MEIDGANIEPTNIENVTDEIENSEVVTWNGISFAAFLL